MDLRQLIIDDIQQLLDENTYNVNFIIGKPAELRNSKFAIQTQGNEWYEITAEEFVPVSVNELDGAFLAQANLRATELLGDISFLVPFEKQDNVIEAVYEFINKMPGRNQILTALDEQEQAVNTYSATYSIGVPKFIDTNYINDIRFVEYNFTINVLLMENAFSVNDIVVSLQTSLIGQNYIELPLISYSPMRMRQTQTLTVDNTNYSVVRNSTWAASVIFFLSTKVGDLQNLSKLLIRMIEDNTIDQNTKVNIRIVYKPFNLEINKEVLITQLQPVMDKTNAASISITVEEAYNEVI
jgi:hypothetical protein